MKKFVILILAMTLLLTGCGIKEDNSTITDMENYLMNNGLLEGERIEPMPVMIGAIDGFKYIDSRIEVYMYDIKSDAYKNLVKKKSVILEGFNLEMPVAAVNGKFVLFYTGNDERVVEIFNEFDYRDAPIQLDEKYNLGMDKAQTIPTPELEKTTKQLVDHFDQTSTMIPEDEPIPTVILTPTPMPTSVPTPSPTPIPAPIITENSIPEDEPYYEEVIVYEHDIAEDDINDNYYDFSVLDPDDAAKLAERNYIDNFSNEDFIIIDEPEDD